MAWSEREGVAGVALLAMFADGVIAAEEDEVLRDLLQSYPLFEDMDDDGLGAVLERLERRNEEVGPERLLDECAAALTPRLRPTAYLIAAEVIAADGVIVAEEDAFLGRVRASLGLPSSTADAVRQSIAIRMQR